MDTYAPAELRNAKRTPRSSNIFTLLTRDVSHVHGHSHRNAAVSPRQASWPIVLFRAGASAEVAGYSTLTEDLASHGYVVVGIDAPYRTGEVAFPDGRVILRAPQNNPEAASGAAFQQLTDRLLAEWTRDMSFAVDRLAQLNAADPTGRFTGRLDLTRVGAFGHSFGGAQAAQFCHDDARCTAAVDIDGAPAGSVVQRGIRKPLLFVLSDHSGESGPESAKIMADVQAVGGRRVVIPGAFHFTFSDDGAVIKSGLLRGVMRLFGKLRIDARRQLAMTTEYVHTFFDGELR
jgi:predicted dienelactone hydrolase